MDKQPIAIWTLNERGLKTALRIRGIQGLKIIFTPSALKGSYDNPRISGYDDFSDSVKKGFHEYKAHVFIMATGIVIRTISSLIEDKTKDPAIVVMDDMGKNVISLLSGHMGGANALTRKLADILGGHPVITTATDISGITAVDEIARQIDAVVENKEMIKTVSAAMLNNEPVALICDKGLFDKYYGNSDYRPDHFEDIIDVNPHDYQAICIISEKNFLIPTDELTKTLLIHPRIIVLGIGCNKGTTEDEIKTTVEKILKQKGISTSAISDVATIDRKKDEPGLLAFCKSINRELKYYSAETLNSVEYEGMSPPSFEAQKHVGAKGVAEPAALECAGKDSELIVNKIKSGNMTLAIARKKTDY